LEAKIAVPFTHAASRGAIGEEARVAGKKRRLPLLELAHLAFAEAPVNRIGHLRDALVHVDENRLHGPHARGLRVRARPLVKAREMIRERVDVLAGEAPLEEPLI